MISLLLILISSIILFILGYNYTFKTKKTIAKNMSLAKYDENSKKYKRLMSESNMVSAKICGVIIIIMAIISFVAFVVRMTQYFMK